MNLRLTLIFVFIFLWSIDSNAQEEVSIVTKDTVQETINPLSPSKAAFYSAVVPGLGQIYNKKYWKLPLVYGGLAAGIYFYTWNNNKYHEYRDEYKRRLDGTSDPNHPIYAGLDDDRLIRAQKFHQRNRDLSALITAGIYILNIVDANVDAHLMQFNVNDNLSLAPDIHQNQIDYKFNTGVKLTFNF
ncbi:hypothetical protein DI487_11005 [Flavobacterium sediminis]|uniref:DUF5683 domain-containing protein n=1 Tax=Flavobacterium sediminis TaxID=2201181 RepID=A0A2U8QVV3_9FLAO|nr:hypothetical protein DI487_11005 [Flavobacterium sediminis]